MNVEVILHNSNFYSVGEAMIHEILHLLGMVELGALVSNFDVSPANQRREKHEEIGGAVAFILIVTAGRLPRLDGVRNLSFAD